jgi:hypothetical protein
MVLLEIGREKIMSTNKIIKLMKENGIFLIFKDYDDEGDFPRFLELLKKKLGAKIKEPKETIYSITAEMTINDIEVIGLFRDDLGCVLRLDVGENSCADEIITKCNY